MRIGLIGGGNLARALAAGERAGFHDAIDALRSWSTK
jgi:pyrroline-5-carboxylate reductase